MFLLCPVDAVYNLPEKVRYTSSDIYVYVYLVCTRYGAYLEENY